MNKPRSWTEYRNLMSCGQVSCVAWTKKEIDEGRPPNDVDLLKVQVTEIAEGEEMVPVPKAFFIGWDTLKEADKKRLLSALMSWVQENVTE